MKQRTRFLLLILIMALSVACGDQAAPTATPQPDVVAPEVVDPTVAATEEQAAAEEPAEEPAMAEEEAAADIDYSAALIAGAEGDLSRVADAPRYHMNVALDFANATYSGDQQIDYTNTEDVALDALYLRLFPNGGKSYGDGNLLVSNVLVDGVSAETALSLDDTVLEIALPAPVEPGGAVQLTLDFTGSVATPFSGDGRFQQGENLIAMANWYPTLAVYNENGWNLERISQSLDSLFADIGWYNVQVSVDKEIAIATTGTAAEITVEGDMQKLDIVSGPVREFFIYANSNAEVVTEVVDGVTINVYVEKGKTGDARTAMEVAVGSLETFNEKFGLYPYTELDLVTAPLFHLGVEFSGIVLIADFAYDKLSSLTEVVAHEIGHQWWYGLVGNDTYNSPWLDESLTTYSAVLYLESLENQTKAEEEAQRLSAMYNYTQDNGLDDVITLGLDHYEGQRQKINLVIYQKGALFYLNLREKIGDEAFFSALQTYFRENQYGIGSAESLLGAFADASDVPLDEFYDVWLFNSANTFVPIAAGEVDAETDALLFERMSTVFQLFANNADEIWNANFRFDQQPILMVHQEANSVRPYGYLFNHPGAAELESAELVETDPALNLSPVYKITVFPSSRIQSMQTHLFQEPIGDVNALVWLYNAPDVGHLSAPSDSDFSSLLVHEGLNNQQHISWANTENNLQDISRYPLDGDSIASIQLENMLLMAALQASDAETRDKAVQQFVAVRSARLDAHDIVGEIDGVRERYEGTARYVEHVVETFIPNADGVSAEGNLELTLDPNAKRSELTFDRFYATGAALSLLLDELELDLDWKLAVEEGQTPYQLISNHFGLTDDSAQKATLLAEAHAAYGYEDMRVAAAVTAETVDEGDDGLSNISVEDIQKDVDPGVEAAISQSVPDGFEFVGGFTAEAAEVESEIFLVDYTPDETPFTITDYSNGTDSFRISAAEFFGSLDDAAAVRDFVLSDFDLANVRTSMTLAGVDVQIAQYSNGTVTSMVFSHDEMWYSIQGTVTLEEVALIVQELATP